MTDRDVELVGRDGQAGDDGGEGPPEEAAQPTPRRRRGRRVLLVLGMLVLLVVVAVGGFVGYLGWRVSDNITRADLLPTAAPPSTASDGSPIEVPSSGVGTNFLVVGSDSRGSDRGRSDVIVLVHVPEDPTSIEMIHFPRDLYVSIPGHGKNKINAAYAYGGEPLLVETLQNLLGIKIDHVARTNFEGFKNMTDAVGGVRVYAEEGNDASGNGGAAIHRGWNDLDGEQALAFVRERYELSEGDISRGRRQLAFVKALLLKATSRSTLTNPLAVARFTDAATENLVVDRDLTIGAMKDYALELRGIRSSDVVFATAPFSGFASDPQAGSIDVVDTKRMALLGEALRTDTMEDYLDVFVTP
ncbi:LCP family protein [Phycicoccus endophyticus]|nr:LCP family protein [Phycicoccus endophyticus]